MEQFPSIENNKLEGSSERMVKKARKLFGIWGLSAVMAFGMSSQAGAQEHNHAEMPDVKKSERSATLPKKEAIQSIEEQRNWIIQYILSPKYKERLTKEYARYRALPSESKEAFSESFTKPIIDAEGDTSHVANAFEGWVRTFKRNAQEFDLMKATNIDEVFPSPDLSQLSDKDREYIEYKIRSREKSIRQSKYVLVNSIGGDVNIDGRYKLFSEDHDIEIVNKRSPDAQLTAVHEFTHHSTLGNLRIPQVTQYIIDKYAAEGSSKYLRYLKDPTEVIARLNVVRYLFEKYAEYDAKTQEFTEKEYEVMKENEKFRESYNIRQILETFEKDELIWLMNNIADTNDSERSVMTTTEGTLA